MELKKCIPFAFERLNKVIPGIMPETYYCVTANTSVGKTQFTKYLFVRKPIDYAIKNNIKLKVLYFAREESEKDFFDTFRLALLKKKYAIKLDLYALQGYRGPLPDEVERYLIEIEPEIQLLSQYVDVIDTIGNPTGIFKYVRNFANQNGTHYYQNLITGEISPQNDETNYSENYRYHHYAPNDPNSLTIVVIDHVNLINTEKDSVTLFDAMGKLSSDYLLDVFIKRYKYAVVSVHQQVMAGEGIEYYKAGLEKLYPTMDKLGDNKLIGRDYHIGLGLFNPTKFSNLIAKSEFGDYNLEVLLKNFRTLHVLKHRKGEDGLIFPLFFDGGGQTWAELHKPNSSELRAQYDIIRNKRLNGEL